MAEGIKIRSLDITSSLVDSDVLIIDNVTADDLTTAVTKQIRYDDFITDLSGRDLTFSGEVIFNGNISLTGDIELSLEQLTDVNITDVSVNDTLVYDGTQWVNGESSSSFNGDYIALKPNSEDASVDNIVYIKVTKGPKVNSRFMKDGGDLSFYLEEEEAPFLIFSPGRTYIFDQSDPSNLGISDPQQFRLRIFPNKEKGFFTYIESPGFVEYSSEAPGTPGSYTKLVMKNIFNYNTVFYDSEFVEFMGNGIFNPDGSEEFSIGPYIDSLQQQINTINNQLKDLIEIEQG